MPSLIPYVRTTQLAPRHPQPLTTVPPHQLDLVLDDERVQGMTPAARRSALRLLARLLLEATGVALREGGDDL